MASFRYRGAKASQISFPLGGIGAGCIGLAGNGRLIDWEIFNRPAKGGLNGYSHFAVKAERAGRVLDARVLHADLPPPYTGQLGRGNYAAFGFGPPREWLAGMPHLRDAVFVGKFPTARVEFVDTGFPGRVALDAWSPFIPGDEDSSSIPAAFFEITLKNTTDEAIDYWVAATLGNPLPAPNAHTIVRLPEGAMLCIASDAVASDTLEYAELALVSDDRAAGVQRFWYRGGWNDNLEVYWRDFTSPGGPVDRHYDADCAGNGNHGTLYTRVAVAPGAEGRARFAICWYVPNVRNYWNPDACASAEKRGVDCTWRNWYATRWSGAAAVGRHALREWSRLRRETLRFQRALFRSSLPHSVLDAVSANLAVLKSPTVLRLENGALYGFEGCHPDSGCCEGSCTHVWNYQQAVPFLFPALERSMRETDYAHNLQSDGAMPFRLQLPLGAPASGFRPCADGQFGGVMKAYRDWRVCGDADWLAHLWPSVKASIAYAWHPANADHWDPDRTGVLHGRQHHTLDMELFGPNSWLTGFYIGALVAGSEMAEAVGELETARDLRAMAERGRAWLEANLFNGEYYQQQVDLADRSLLDRFGADEYWSAEHSEIKYQIAGGCAIDQVLPQWHADLYGLGSIYEHDRVASSLRALFSHNFKDPIRAFYNPWRVFCVNDEAGLVMCEWPEGCHKPAIPLTYAQETMHGFEYAAAGLMILRGLCDEGEAVVSAIRRRYDGERRNPWNEIECGSNYARSMASYALLHSYSGFRFDMRRGMIGFRPARSTPRPFRCFWSLGSAWGDVVLDDEGATLRLLYGQMTLRSLALPFAATTVRTRKGVLGFESSGDEVALSEALHMLRGDTLFAGR